MEERPTHIGSRLQQARERRGLTLRDLASATKISINALKAIEHNDFDLLPSGAIFRRAYVRAFAAEVGLDPDELAAEYRAAFETETAPEGLVSPESDVDDGLRALRRLAVLCVTAIGFLICGLLIWVPGEAPQAISDEEWALSAVPASLPENAASSDGAEDSDEPALAHPADSDTTAHSLRLELRLSGQCWISAFADDERIIYRLVEPGERILLEAQSAITLRLGDAGTVAYSINGVAGRPLGRHGEAVTVRFTSDNLVFYAVEPAST